MNSYKQHKIRKKISSNSHRAFDEITVNVLRELCLIGREIIGKDLNDIITIIIDIALEKSNAERGMIVLFENGGTKLFDARLKLNGNNIDHPQMEISSSIISKVKSSGEVISLCCSLDDSSFFTNDSVRDHKILSVMCLPLISNDEVFGVMYLDNSSLQSAFSEGVCEFLKALCEFISLALFHALEHKKLVKHNQKLEKDLRSKYHFESIIGHHPKMIELLKLVSQVANIDATVLIQGESGTGKELIARALHFNSNRRDNPFVPINCGAITENLLESELFGHVRGAFTGATDNKIGWFESANSGTIFLDEVSEMSRALQVKLLRVLQSGEYTQVGSSEIHFTNVRIVAATNKELKDLITNEKFRDDLYYRLNIIDLNIPSLKERKSDIPALIQYFLKIYSEKYKKENLFLTRNAKYFLLEYDYPGNVRELENVIQRAVALAEDEQITTNNLPPNIYQSNQYASAGKKVSNFKFAKKCMSEKFEYEYIHECLKRANGNISKATKIAGIQYANFYKKVKKYNIESSEYKIN